MASHVSPNTVKSHKIVAKSLLQSHGEQLESLEGFSIVVPSHTAKVRTNCDPQASHKVSIACMGGTRIYPAIHKSSIQALLSLPQHTTDLPTTKMPLIYLIRLALFLGLAML